MTRVVLLAVLALALLSSCGNPKTTENKLTIATAANMQFAMEDLIDAFKAESGIDCETVISSSGKLTAQIREGAPFDLFISADMKYPTDLFAGGYTTAAPEVYAYGKLVLWSMIDSLQPAIDMLSAARIRHIAIANPRTAPYGLAALEVLAAYELGTEVEGKLIYGESIAQTNQFIISKAAEMGFTAKSVVLSPQMRGRGKWLELDPQLYTPIAQGVVLLKKETGRRMAAQRFYDFLFSDTARKIMAEFGYGFE